MSLLSATRDSRTGIIASLLWAVFLACSWTWCIGMFLPVLLVRDFGIAGWVVFTVPNVVGAALMGWVLRSADASTQLMQVHRRACHAFSLVTIAFHVFFVLWLVCSRMLSPGWFALAFAAVLAVSVAPARASALWISSLLVYVISLAALALTVVFFAENDVPRIVPPTGAAALGGALLLAPVCIFGFFLCPWLDLTFHSVRQSTTVGGARIAFGLGFGVFFLAMLIFSLIYAPALARILGPQTSPLPQMLMLLIGIHMLVQSGFTIGAHARQLAPAAQHRPASRNLFWGILITAVPAIFAGAASVPREVLGLDLGELIYRIFMGFYGLLFPAYVWVFMVPSRKTQAALLSARLVFFAAVVLASPFFALGFIGNRMIWLLPGLAIILAAKLLSRASPSAEKQPIHS